MSMRTIIQMLKPGLLISITALLATTVQAQQVYKWKDAKGVLHYTQTPPPARYSQSVNIKARSLPAPAANSQETAPAADQQNSVPKPVRVCRTIWPCCKPGAAYMKTMQVVNGLT